MRRSLSILGPYYLPGPDNRLAIVGLKDLYFALQEFQIFGSTYIYDLQENAWVQCSQIEIFQMIDLEFETGPEQDCPGFTPPPTPFNKKFVDVYQESAYFMMLLLKKQKFKVTQLSNELQETEMESFQTKALNDQWREQFELVDKERSELLEEIEALKVEHQLQLEHLQSLPQPEADNKEFEELLEINKRLQKKLSLMEIKEKESEQRLAEVQKQLEHLKKATKKILIESEKLKKELQQKQDLTQQLSETLETKNYEIDEIKKENKLHKKLIANIKNDQQNKSKEEIKRLTGEAFELSNEPVWEYKQSGKSHGPFTFEQILDLKRETVINEHTLMKNLESAKSWMALSEYFEFNAPFEVILTEEDGKAIKRFFMKRGSIRAPFYDTVTISIDEVETKGICTSISAGGCFIELARLKEGSFTKDQKAFLTINHETLGQAISCPIIIKNISLSRPKGIGVMFESLDNESLLLIENFVNLTLNKTRSLKAA